MSDDEVMRTASLKAAQKYFEIHHRFIVFEPTDEIKRVYRDQIPDRYDGIWFNQEEVWEIKIKMMQAKLPEVLAFRNILFNETNRFVMRDDAEIARVWELKFQ